MKKAWKHHGKPWKTPWKTENPGFRTPETPWKSLEFMPITQVGGQTRFSVFLFEVSLEVSTTSPTISE